MGPHYLHRVFTPDSVAVIGATPRESAVGNRVLRNMIQAEYEGELFLVNPKYDEIDGRRCYPSLKALGRPVDLAVVVTPAATVPDVIEDCGKHGVYGAVVISAGFREAGPAGVRLEEAMMTSARRHGVRVVGPNCLGIMQTSRGLNATFSHNVARRGDLALVSQSGALCTSILDWALANQVGFSSMISMGAAADIDFGEVLDYLAVDPDTRSILLYVEGLSHARRFMSGLRVAARMKPVVVVKAGRYAEGSKAAFSHTGSLVGSDDVFDAALRRAGVVRVYSIGELFAAAQILASGYRVKGNRLGVVTNAGGPGVLAADRAAEVGVSLPDLDADTMQALDAILPDHWSRGNPADILGDAPPDRYGQSVALVQKDRNVDGTLVMFTPTAMSDPTEAAKQVIGAAKQSRKPTIACWLGENQVREARAAFTEHGVPSFETPEASIEAFGYLASHYRNQQLLRQVPGPLPERKEPDAEGARMIIEGALADRRKTLNTLEAKAVLAAFGIPTLPAHEATSANEALVAAESLGFPVAMKIHSEDISHKSDVGGVRLDIENAHQVRSAYTSMIERVQAAQPQARILGVTVEKMCKKRHGREILVGVLRDSVFGPAISFGAGGTAVEVMRDRAVALPPLNHMIIQDLIAQTRVSKLLGRFRNMPPADLAAIERVLLRVSALVCELPHIRELDINPLIVDEDGAVAVDVRIAIDQAPPSTDPYAHMAVHPYPTRLVTRWQLAGGTDLVMRPIRPEDANIEDTFVRNLSPESKYFRFMQALQELTPEMLVRFTQIDYDREMAFIVTTEIDGQEAQIAVGRYVTNPDRDSCEFAVVVGDDWRNKGIATRIIMALMEEAKSRGLRTMEGEILAENHDMLNLVKRMGFEVQPLPGDHRVVQALIPL